MAWPFSRLTTYLANSTPVIKAFDLNQIQDYLVLLFSGTRTVKALEATEAGDGPTTVVPGQVKAAKGFYAVAGDAGGWAFQAIQGAIVAYEGFLRAGKEISGAATPTASPLSLGAIHKDLCPIAWAVVQRGAGSASLIRGANIAAVTPTPGVDGTTTVDLVVPGAHRLCAVATAEAAIAVFAMAYQSGGPNKVAVETRDVAGARYNANFNLVVFGA